MANNDDDDINQIKKKINERDLESLKPYVEAISKTQRNIEEETQEIRRTRRTREEYERRIERLEAQRLQFSERARQETDPKGKRHRELRDIENVIEKQRQRQSDLYERENELEIMHRVQARESLASTLQRPSAHVPSLVHEPVTSRARIMAAAETMVRRGEITEATIEKSRPQLNEKLSASREALTSSVLGFENWESVIEKAKDVEGTKSKMLMMQAGERVLREKGLDTESVRASSSMRREQILKEREDLALQGRVQRGETGGLQKESQKLQELSDKFLQAQENFINSLDQAPDTVEEFKNKLIESSKALEDQKKLVDEIARQKGPDGVDRMASVGAAMQNIGSGIYNLAGTYAYATVGAENENTVLRAEYARAKNLQFKTQYAATQGDMMALSMLESDVFNNAISFASEQRSDAEKAVYGQVTGGGLKTLGSIVKGMAAGAVGGGFTAGPVGSIIGTTIGGLGAAVDSHQTAANALIDQNYALSRSRGELGGFQARYDLNQATNEIKGMARQSFYDMSMKNLSATIGFGARSGGVFDQMRRDVGELGFVYGAGQDEIRAAYQTALMTSGADFTKRGVGGMRESVGRAFQIQNAGITSAQDYLARIGQMSQVGGGDKEIEDILSNAVARGVDNAKSFADLADSISSLSSAAAEKGFSVSGATTDVVLGAMDLRKNSGFNERLNLNSVQRQVKTIEEITSNTDINFANLMASEEITKQLGTGVTSIQRRNILAMSMKEAQQLRSFVKKGELDKARSMAETLGISDILFEESGAVKQGATDKLVEVELRQMEGELAPYISDPEARKRIARGGAKTRYERDIAAMLYGGSDVAKKYATGGGFAGKEVGVGPEGDERKATIEAKRAEKYSESKMIEAGAFVSNGMQGISTALAEVANALNPMKSMAESLKTAAEMKLDTSDFDVSVSTFQTAVNVFANAVGLKTTEKSPMSPQPPAIPQIQEKNKDNRSMNKNGGSKAPTNGVK